ncbi:hypothetical protein AVEN_151627-1 [Araneus ventricosus]|uniref:Uncharacterized protein n=1 Tax=Araneus ventricosus TaxID=182803 RepID=A0A4Y2L2I3_ARAVE|nr:hypothetical protein AVEN_151627-1 [Araneus ventricosus]
MPLSILDSNWNRFSVEENDFKVKIMVNDITNFLAPLNLKSLQCHKLKTKYQSYASFYIEVYENDLQQLLDSTFCPEGCLIADIYGKLGNDQISQEDIPGSNSNHPSCLDLSTNTDSK